MLTGGIILPSVGRYDEEGGDEKQKKTKKQKQRFSSAEFCLLSKLFTSLPFLSSHRDRGREKSDGEEKRGDRKNKNKNKTQIQRVDEIFFRIKVAGKASARAVPPREAAACCVASCVNAARTRPSPRAVCAARLQLPAERWAGEPGARGEAKRGEERRKTGKEEGQDTSMSAASCLPRTLRWRTHSERERERDNHMVKE